MKWTVMEVRLKGKFDKAVSPPIALRIKIIRNKSLDISR